MTLKWKTKTPSERWDWLQEHRIALADQIAALAKHQTTVDRRRVAAVAAWYRESKTFDEAIANPTALAMAAGVLQPQGTASDPTVAALAASARRGVCRFNQDTSPTLRLLQLLSYPMIVMGACLALMLGFCLYIAPEFDDMFSEFGIELPTLTIWLLTGAAWVRAYAWLLLAFAALAVALLGLLLTVPLNRWPRAIGRFVESMTGVAAERQALGRFADHLGMLQAIGVKDEQAFETAVQATRVKSVRARWLQRQAHAAAGANPTEVRLFPESRYRLLDHATQQPGGAASVLLLDQVAAYYRHRSTTISVWWFHWLAAIMQWSMGLFVFFVVAALFMPLISIIGGLTGW